MSHLGYMFAGYTVVIVGLLLYVRRMVSRLREVDEELRELRRRLGDAGPHG
jgi:CcmD family protein